MTDVPAVPRPAATTVLLRRAAPLEVFLIKRVATQRFMGGTHVFPGGRVDDADRDLVARGIVRHAAADRLATLLGLPRDDAMAYASAACRELFEEAGVLMCPGVDDATVRAAHAELQAGAPFADVVTSRGLVVDAGLLAYLAHWVTPVFEPRRFTARFFAVPLPGGQTPRIDDKEAVEGEWFTPSEALRAHLEKRIVLPPPTLCVLDGLSLQASFKDALAGVAAPVKAIEPLLVDDGGAPALVFPGDRLHPDPDGVPGAPTRVSWADGVLFPRRERP